MSYYNLYTSNIAVWLRMRVIRICVAPFVCNSTICRNCFPRYYLTFFLTSKILIPSFFESTCNYSSYNTKILNQQTNNN